LRGFPARAPLLVFINTANQRQTQNTVFGASYSKAPAAAGAAKLAADNKGSTNEQK